ncbi:MAG: DNA-3-methyladenine glycosylase I [Candidatus Azotimanducaceae bacterium]|jgi:DNA-3-methyladenine glycosylase I
MESSNLQRCGWCKGDELYQRYHDEVWGVPERDDRVLFEFLLLEGAQAGLNWITILRKRENYRAAFDGFDAEKIARYDDQKKHALLTNSGIVRNRLKIDSAIGNAQQFLRIKESGESFRDYLWAFVDGKTVQNRYVNLNDVPSNTALSDAMSKQMKRDGFKFVGSTICYAFMQATGMVNDHLLSCHRHSQCLALT